MKYTYIETEAIEQFLINLSGFSFLFLLEEICSRLGSSCFYSRLYEWWGGRNILRTLLLACPTDRGGVAVTLSVHSSWSALLTVEGWP